MAGFLIMGRNGVIDLPYDLSTCILRCMRDNLVSLKSCSLVCRSWSSASRTWLFRKLTLDPKKYSALLALVREFTIEAYSFVSCCRTLDLHSIDVRTIPLPFLILFTALTELRLHNASVPSLKDLFEFTARFPHLRSIVLNHVSWRRTAPIPLPSLPTVKRLEVCGIIDHGHFFDAIEQSEVFPNVLHFAIGPLPETHMPTLGFYLSKPSAPWKLQRLTLSVMWDGHYTAYSSIPFRTSHQYQSPLQDRYRQIYGIEPCSIPLPYLLFLRVKGFIDVQFSTQGIALYWIPRMLASLAMQNIQRIELDITLDRAGQLDQFGIRWSFIDFAFTTTDFSTLKEVVFIFHGPSDLMGVADIICRRLPLSTQRGIIYVRSGAESWDQRVQAV